MRPFRARYPLFLAVILCSACGGSGMHSSGGQDGGGLDAGIPPGCSGVSITQDGVLDVDLNAVRITGAVTLKGAALPANAVGDIVFVEKKTQVTYDLVLASSGGSYQVLLTPGQYDVTFVGTGVECGVPPAPPLPCNGGTLKTNVSLTSDGVLDLDIPAVSVTGTVTAKGAVLMDQGADRGGIGFAAPGKAASVTVHLGSTGAGTYAATLFPGSYDVLFAGDEQLCATAPAPQLPCNAGTLKTNLSLTSDGVLDLDVPTVTVTGAVTAKGAALVDETVDRGSIGFATPGNDASLAISLGQTGPGTYAATLLPGTYDVIFTGNDQLCGTPPAPQLPCNRGTIKKSVSITSNGVLDLDVPVVIVTGTVTAKGAALTDQQDDRGAIGFAPPGQDTAPSPPSFGTIPAYSFSVSLGQTGPGRYAVALVPGSYDVLFFGNDPLCASSTAPQLPCNSGAIKKNVSLVTDGALDLDVPVVTVTGAVTAKGAALTDQQADRGAIGFSAPGQSAGLAVSLGQTGPGSYVATLLPGNYDVSFSGNDQLCASSTAPQLPCNSGTLRANTSLTSDGALDLDVPAVTITGNVTLAGAQLPDTAGQERGSVRFSLVHGGSASSGELAPTGAASYAMTLLPGSYVVAYEANPDLCQPTPSGPAPPCSDQIVKGCD